MRTGNSSPEGAAGNLFFPINGTAVPYPPTLLEETFENAEKSEVLSPGIG